jgi:hypothetical protein
MARGELLLDGVLAHQQPVQGGIKLVLIGIRHPEVFGESRALPEPAGGELGVGVDDARGHHGQHQVAFPAGLRGQHRSQPQALHGQRHRLHMAMGARAHDLQGLGGANKGLALQRAPNDVDQRIGQVRQIAQSLVLDLAVLAITAPQQMRAVDLVLVDAARGDDVCGSTSCWHGLQLCDKWRQRSSQFSDYITGHEKGPEGPDS